MANISFNIKLPAGWEDQTVYTIKGPEDAGVEHQIMVYLDRHLRHNNIKSFAREKIDPIVSNMPGVEVLKDEDISIEGCNAAYEFVYKWIPTDEQIFYQKYVFVIADDAGFTFHGTFTKRTYKTVGRQFKDVVEALLPGTYKPLED